jgi:hypothetical protein
MTDPSQFLLSHKKLVELIVKDAGVHEGHWMLMVAFGFVPGNFGQNPETSNPGVVVALSQIGIQRVDASTGAPDALVVDAAEVNPSSRPLPNRRKKS